MKDSKYNRRKANHVDIKYNFVKDMISHKEVNINYISTQKMVANLFIKILEEDVFNKHINLLSLCRC
jgi:hypothetical protein